MHRIRTGLVAALLLGAMGAAMAGRAGEWYVVIYYDAAGNEVGGASADCGGMAHSWGIRTDNFSRSGGICPK